MRNIENMIADIGSMMNNKKCKICCGKKHFVKNLKG